MKYILFIIISLSTLSFGGCLCYEQQIWLLAGQSNMWGLGTCEEVYNNYNNAEIYTPVSGGWQPLECGYGREGGFGLELSFAHNIFPDALLVKIHRGASSLYDDWIPGGVYYNEYLSLIFEAAQRPNTKIAGLLWMQGESDALSLYKAQAYKKNLKLFITNIRKDLNLPDLPVIIGQISDASTWRYGDIIQQAQLEVARETRYCKLVKTNDLPFIEDNIHYNNEGLTTLGKRFARKAKKLFIRRFDRKAKKLFIRQINREL